MTIVSSTILLAGVPHEFCIPLQLTADDVLQAGHDVAPDVLRPNRAALDQAVVLGDRLAGHRFNVG